MAALMKKLTIEGDLQIDIDVLKKGLMACKAKGFTPVIIYEIEGEREVQKGGVIDIKGTGEGSGWILSLHSCSL